MEAWFTIEPFGEHLTIRPGESVLAAVLRQGRFVRHGCKHGGCGACRALLVSGECHLSDRTSFSLSDSDREAGIVLLCSTYVSGSEAVFDVSGHMDLTADEFMAGSQIAEYRAEVTTIELLTPDIRAVRLHLLEPREMKFTAGQYMEIEVPGDHDQWRSFSMSSDPEDAGNLEIIVKVIPDGRFSSALDGRLCAGHRLRVRGPFGQFAVRLSHRPLVMVAGGSGIGPIRSMLRVLCRTGNTRRVTLCYGARRARDLLFVDELRAIEQAHDWFTFVPALSEPEPGVTWDGETGLIAEVVGRVFPSLRGTEGYLCGPPTMVDAALETLVAAGCKERHIYFDRFVPSG
ncbi:MAG TPA: 2Fe-2S iron-sulfur cluster binding domain-containing protein [Kofleriaceae bacterium]|jgi:NAD(P)H-flavin reductase/ferredoxin|nr:2Fe-2S iron-sulfur cluster binding domain-containing protein [Kofleriaceae bacterium]